MNPRRIAALVAAPALAVALSACVSVLPKSDPDQLYSFGHAIEAEIAPPAVAAATAPFDATGVLLGAVVFPRAATGDGILTMTGSQSAYIAESRWVAPASLLFREAIDRSFDRKATRVRLVNRGEAGRTAMILRIEVRDFAALYPNGPEGLPVVAVAVHARLARADGTPVAERLFEARRRVSENRVAPIVDGFDKAVEESLTALVAWTDQTAAGAAVPGAGPR